MTRFKTVITCVVALFMFVELLILEPVCGQSPTILEGKSQDVRMQPLKDLNGYFPFTVPDSPEDWQARAEQLRFQVKVALGLVPEPTRTKLNFVIHGKIDRGDYTVEKVFFESMPDFYVTGSLYRPKTVKGKVPGVLCPHGHWSNGRFYDAGEAQAKAQIEQGAESDLEAARNPIQARCVHLARMGCIVFQYDMIGYADSVQITFDLAHRFAKPRPAYNSAENWGLFSPQAEQNLQSIMGLQTWNSIRALDFLESLKDVDQDRLAVTGASGGGTQTFLLAAVDDRIKVSFPAVMVSTAMQGGCTCENCSLLRVTTGNVELAALFAPKPMGVTAANDWTKEMRTKGFPELKNLYKLLGAEDDVMLVDRTEFGHNYNKVSRTAMYQWFKQHLGLAGSVEERPYRRLTAKELSVWNDKIPRPEFDPDFERRLLKWWKTDTDKSLKEIASSKEANQTFLSRAFQAVFQRDLPGTDDVEYESTYKKDHGSYFVMGGLVKWKSYQEEFPVLFVHPKEWNGKVVVMTSDQGKNVLYADEGQLTPLVKNLVDSGVSVVSPDLFYQGEFLDGIAEGQSTADRNRKVKNPREAAAYSFGYNHTLFAQRTHDLLALLTMVRTHERKPESISLVGIGQTGAICNAALALDKRKIARFVMDKKSLTAFDVNDIYAAYFLPGSGRYQGLQGMQSASGMKPVVVNLDGQTGSQNLERILVK